MSFFSVLEICHNDRLPNWSNPPEPVYLKSQSNSTLIPFYIHLPDQLPNLQLLRSATPTPPSNPSTPSKPLSSYLTRANSSHQLDRLPHLHPPQSVYDIHQQTRDAGQPVGFLRTCVLQALLNDNTHIIQSHCRPCWKLFYPHPSDLQVGQDHPALPCCVSFEDWINLDENPFETRSEHLHRLVRGWKEIGLFRDQLSGWRNECYSVYGPKDEQEGQNHLPGANVAFKIERAAVGLFGLLSFGAHLTAYVKKDQEYFFWIPRRSPNKPTWPSKLDNTVAGGISSGETSLETILRESVEEASFPQEFVSSNVRSTGLISYTHRNTDGWIQPEIQYTFDLELPSEDENGLIPRPNDGETADFRLMNTADVFQAIQAGEFKPNCAAVLVDFFVRHGILSELNEHQFCSISTFLKSLPGLPIPS